ncbi:nucleotidyltransferase domain-containing protein [Bacillus sp. 3255]|uniref:nucleotidyltransferase domain-containing protein n=1 Tax=Bacillus sp. 3255 TaxID=2817904 RepID=UPI0023789775|nr:MULTISPECIES: nucleotidyltransferase domain-containing protein [Bacillales]MDD9268850.1 DUF4111 domain-containing protein [Paenibacillus sp. MAHUQ-63]
MVGLYVHGSLALGDYHPETSDVDFLGVTRSELQAAQRTALAHMHDELRSQGFPAAEHMEGSYIPQASLKRYDPQHCRHPALRCDGSFGVDGHGSDWIIQRAIIRGYGITLCGPAPDSLIAPVTAEELRWAARSILQEWWAPLLKDASRLGTSEYQAYAILTMCRCLYTMDTGLVASKPAAGKWAMGKYGEAWEALIRQALAWRRGMELDVSRETLSFVRFTLGRACQ